MDNEIKKLINELTRLLGQSYLIDEEYDERPYRWFVSAAIKVLQGDKETALRNAGYGCTTITVFIENTAKEQQMNSMRSLDKGTEIVIMYRNSEYTCIVDSAINYGTPEKPDWYIECHDKEGGYSRYWKQSQEGGKARLA